jgi:arabinofuranan 3-O-arabinosyltransferase
MGTLSGTVDSQPSSPASASASVPAEDRDDGVVAGTRRRSRRLDYLICAVVAFVPMMWAQPGKVTDDTKTYLYLNPGRYMREAVSLWNPNIALGTVTHENIGYLLPMGPFYWLMAELHVPLWVAQRLWLGGLLFAAGAGMLYLCRTIGLTGPGRAVATLAFMFTPYVLQYSGRISVILMPWAGLPWMLAFVMLALRRGGWRYPALFALVVAMVSGINASSILYVGIGPVLWLPYAVVVLREHSWSELWRVVWRVGLLTTLVSLWWVIGLQVEAAYGVNILKYTETLSSTSSASSPTEIVRGLGYWFFYGASDQLGPWTQAAVAYTQHLWLIALSFLIPTMALLAAVLVNWRKRAFFMILVVVGMVLAVGPYPYYRPTTMSGLIKAFMQNTTAGLALRSTDRASPLVILGLAVLLGAGTTVVVRHMTRWGWALTGFVLAAIAGASAPLWLGSTVVNGLIQPVTPPPYVLKAVQHLNTTHPGLRVYGLPGNNFGAYRWGDTIDTVYPAYLNRPFVTHEQQTMGSLPTADLLEAVDTPLQEGIIDNTTLAPMMALMSVGDVLVQYDLAYEKYGTPDPKRLAQDFAVVPPGLSNPVSFGTPRPNRSAVPNVNEAALAVPLRTPERSPLVTYTVDHPRPVVRAESLAHPLLVAGNSAGLVNASSVGLLAANPTIFYSGTLDTEAALRARTFANGPSLVVTDTNRDQGYRWNGITLNAGYARTATEGPDVVDPFDSPLSLFPHAPANAQTTTTLHGIESVTASSYGSPVQYFNEERPAAAIDGDPSTAWTMSQYPAGQWWQIKLASPVTSDSINLSQLITPRPRQLITKVYLSFDRSYPVITDLGLASQSVAGQTIRFSNRTFSSLRITIIGSAPTRYHVNAGYQNFTGFSEIRIPGVDAQETVVMPEDLLRAAGTSSLADPLTLVMHRERNSGYPPRADPEPKMARKFWLPTSRVFSLAGQVRLSPLAPDAVLNGLVGRTAPGGTSLVASSSSRLGGDINAGASAAIDGNPATAWQTAIGVEHQAGAWTDYHLNSPITFDQMHLQVVTDREHSLPSRITVSAGGRSDTVRLPPLTVSPDRGTITDVPLPLSALTGSSVRITVDSVELRTTVDFASRALVALPIGIAEWGIAGLHTDPVPTVVPATCRGDLLAVDGAPLWVRASGTSAAALSRQALPLTLCGTDVKGLALGPGDHVLRSVVGSTSGLDIDQLAFASAPGGLAVAAAGTGQVPVPVPGDAPVARVVRQTSTAIDVSVSRLAASDAPFMLILGQSINNGWQATVGGHVLAAPVLTDAIANGWVVDPVVLGSAIHHGTVDVTLRWTPQRTVNFAVFISAAAIALCLVLAVVPWSRRRKNRRGGADTGVDDRHSSASDDLAFDQDPPEFASRATYVADPVPWYPTMVVAFPLAAAGVVIASIPVGLIVGLATGVALRKPRARRWLGMVAMGCLLAAGAYVTFSQWASPNQSNGGWPSWFNAISGLTWAAILFLAADAAVELVQRRRATTGESTACQAQDV